MPSTTKSRPAVKMQDSPLAITNRIDRPATDSASSAPPATQTPRPERVGVQPTLDASALELAPPGVDEPNARLAVDIPESLVDAVGQMAEQLRRRGGRRVSQKQLPNRELLAALVWDTLGNPESEAAVDRMEARLNRYRAKQLSQAAAAAERAGR